MLLFWFEKKTKKLIFALPKNKNRENMIFVLKLIIDIILYTLFILMLPALVVYSFIKRDSSENSQHSFLINISMLRTSLKMFLHFFQKRELQLKKVIILGNDETIERMKENPLPTHQVWGVRVKDNLSIDAECALKKFEDILRTSLLHEIYIITRIDRESTLEKYKPFLDIAHNFGKKVKVFHSRKDLFNFTEAPLAFYAEHEEVFFSKNRLSDNWLLIKKVMDIVGGIVGSSIALCMFPIVGLLIKLETPGPILFKQRRIGKKRKPFYIYKFRTMGVNAEKQKKDLMDQNELEGAVFKMKNDPRVTRVGKILRKFSIDEFPQFFNVIKGEMSLVGTRPPTHKEVKEYENWHHKRISIKPGVTGMWQVSGRNEIKDFDEIVKLDIQYIDNWSLWLDIKIIFKTFKAIFEGQ